MQNILMVILDVILIAEAIWYHHLIKKKSQEYKKLVNLYEAFKESVKKYNEEIGRDQGKDI